MESHGLHRMVKTIIDELIRDKAKFGCHISMGATHMAQIVCYVRSSTCEVIALCIFQNGVL